MTSSTDLLDLAAQLEAMDPKDIPPALLVEFEKLAGTYGRVWSPLAGPQTLAYECTADVVGYGGAAGGGKSDLAIGKALTQHRRVQMFRREGTELGGLIDRMAEVVGHRNGLGGKPPIWRNPHGQCEIVEFGSVPNPGDERKYQGRPKDLLVIDEAANFLEAQVRFLMGWVRTTVPGQRTQTLMTFNPPTSAEGQWVVRFFAPWLDKRHPRPAKPGELRYFAMVDGREIEVADGRPFKHGAEIVLPQSRTFIASRITDNPFLMGTNYMATLQALPEPLRSQMLRGDFEAGMEDDAMQVIPTAWVDAAMERWKPKDVREPMDSMGIDVARGGQDNTVIARRHGNWFDVPLVYPGKQTRDGPSVAGLVVAAARDGAAQHIDVIGVGSSPYDFLILARQHVFGVNVGEAATGTDQSGRFTFANLRSQLWWRMREALDPSSNRGIALPPDDRLRADLCAPTWRLVGPRIQVESREQIIDRIGRSPDWASAYLLALMDTPRRPMGWELPQHREQPRTDDWAAGAVVRDTDRGEYDPLASFR